MLGTSILFLLVISTAALILVIVIGIGILKIMVTLGQIKTTEEQQVLALNTISTDLASVSRKVDQLILQGSSGGGTDQAAIDAIADEQKKADEQITNLAGTVKTLGETVDGALGPHPEPQKK